MDVLVYSYSCCLSYSLDLLKQFKILNCQFGTFYQDMAALCGVGIAEFWANLYVGNLSSFQYADICGKIRSYLIDKQPVGYLNQKCWFYGLPFKLEKQVFIPQHDTEILVNSVLLLSSQIWEDPASIKVLEICCGVGNISIALANQRLNWHFTAVDINQKALSLARENAENLRCSNLRFLESNLFSNVEDCFQIIISNPPYVSQSTRKTRDLLVQKQPRDALFARNNGYWFYKKIIKDASSFVSNKFLIAFEIGYKQETTIIKIIVEHFFNVKIRSFKDFSGKVRVIAFYRF